MKVVLRLGIFSSLIMGLSACGGVGSGHHSAPSKPPVVLLKTAPIFTQIC